MLVAGQHRWATPLAGEHRPADTPAVDKQLEAAGQIAAVAGTVEHTGVVVHTAVVAAAVGAHTEALVLAYRTVSREMIPRAHC